MKTAVSLQLVSPAKKIAFGALFAALCCIGTVIVQIPAPQGGFLNVGDVFVLLSGWCLGPIYGSIAAAVGSALADIVVGFPLYAPATFIIKGLDALVAYLLWAFFKKWIVKDTLDFLPRLFSAVFAESVMVLGYALYDYLLADWGAAILNMPFNVIQACVCIVGGVLLCVALTRYKQTRNLFSHLEK